MKKSMDNIDTLFKQHFEQTSTEVVDKEGLWTVIGRERSSRKRMLFWVFMLGIMVTSLGVYWMLGHPETHPVMIEKSMDLKELKSEKTPLPNVSKSKTPEPIVSTQPLKKVVSENIFQEKSLTASNSFIKKETPQGSTLKEKTSIIKVENESVSFNKIESLAKIVKSISIQNNAVVNNNQTIKTDISNINTLTNSALQVIDYTKEEQTLELEQFDVDEINRKWDKCYVKAPGQLFLNGYGQASYPIEAIYQQSDSDEIDTHQALWEEKMTPFMSYQAGIQIGYQFPWNGYISGGLSYQHFETKYENMQTVTERITIFDEMAYFYIDDAGETVWVADSVTVTNVYDRQQTFANQHQLWHVPIQLGYMSEQNNWRLGANVEAAINLSKTYQGHFIRLDNSVIELDKTQATDYVSNNIGLSLSLGLHAGYMLNEHWELYVSPRFRTNNLSFLKSDQALDIKYQFAGVRTGLKYWF